jgi:hypothetical protein
VRSLLEKAHESVDTIIEENAFEIPGIEEFSVLGALNLEWQMG